MKLFNYKKGLEKDNTFLKNGLNKYHIFFQKNQTFD